MWLTDESSLLNEIVSFCGVREYKNFLVKIQDYFKWSLPEANLVFFTLFL